MSAARVRASTIAVVMVMGIGVVPTSVLARVHTPPSGAQPAGAWHAGWNDYDGNGYDDLAIGTPGDTVNGHPGAGSVTVIYSDSKGLHSATSHYWSQASPDVAGAPEDYDAFGWSLVSGDFDGDGFADLAIGVPKEVPGGDTSKLGAVHVLFGSSSGLKGAGSRLIESPDKTRFGDSLVTLDNIDGVADGKADLAVGAPGRAGFKIYSGPGIVSGSLTGWSKTFPVDTYAGDALAAGRFDDDTVDDIAVAMPLAGSGAEGRVDVYTGHSVLHYGSNSLSVALQSDDQLGTALASGDLDGDGQDELIMGAPYGAGGGRVLIAPSTPSGPDAASVHVLTQASVGIPVQAVSGFGASLATGFFDAGSNRDLAIGLAYRKIAGAESAGAVVIRYNSSVSGTLITQATQGIADDPEDHDYLGWGLAAANWGRGGRSDLAIGVPWESIGSTKRAGAVHILYGSNTGLSVGTSNFYHQGYILIVGQPAQDDYFGMAVH